jgi:hypothetical protein
VGRSDDKGRRREESRATALRDDHGLEVIGHRHAADLEVSHEDLPYEEPEQYGIRISWQSEAERLEAAEFLVATRIQEDTRRRTSRELDEMRHRVDAEQPSDEAVDDASDDDESDGDESDGD